MNWRKPVRSIVAGVPGFCCRMISGIRPMPSSAAFASIFVVAQAVVAPMPAPMAVRLESSIRECPTAFELQAALRQVLGDGQWSSDGWVLAYRRDASAANADRDVSLLMEVVDPAGEHLVERRISATQQDCPAVAGAMAAVVERSLRTLGWTRGEPLPMSARQTYVVDSRKPTEPVSQPTAPLPVARERPPRLIVGVGPALGISPRTGTNLLLEARVHAGGPLYLQVGGGLLSGTDSQAVGAGTARLTSRNFSVAPLAVFVFGRMELAGGPIALVGIDDGSSTGLDQGGSGYRATLAVGATLAASLRLSPRWRLSAGLEGFRAALGADYAVTVGGKRTVVLAPSSWTGLAAVRLEFVAWQ